MARGWESKAVGDQIDDAAEARTRRRPAGSVSSGDEAAAGVQRAGLLLSRARVLHDLQVACNATYRAQLEQALRDIDRQLADTEDA